MLKKHTRDSRRETKHLVYSGARHILESQGKRGGQIVRPVFVSDFLETLSKNVRLSGSKIFVFLAGMNETEKRYTDMRATSLFGHAVFGKVGVHTQSKGFLIESVLGKLPTAVIPKKQEEDSIAHRIRALREHREIVVKNAKGAEARGVYRLKLLGRGIIITSHEQAFLQELKNVFGGKCKWKTKRGRPTGVIVEFDGQNGMREMFRTLDIVYTRFMKRQHKLPVKEGDVYPERVIQNPLVMGKTWEIRVMSFKRELRPDTEYDHMFFGKLGRNAVLGTLDLGGKPSMPLDLIEQAYSSLRPGLGPREKRELSLEFVQTAQRLSETAIGEIERRLNELRKLRLPEFPMDYIPVSGVAIDYMAEYDKKSRRLVPIIIDISLNFGWTAPKGKEVFVAVVHNLRRREMEMNITRMEEQIARETKTRG